MPTVDREEMLNLARRVDVGLMVDLPDGGGSVRDAQVDSLLQVVRTDSGGVLMVDIGVQDQLTSIEPGSCYRRL